MAKPLTLRDVLLFQLILLTLASMFAAQGWFWFRVLRREPLFSTPPTPPAHVPFGWKSIVLVVFTFFATALCVRSVYEKTGQALAATPAPAVEKPVPVGTPEPAKPDGPTLSFHEQMYLMSIINIILLGTIPLLLRLTSGCRPINLGLTRRRLSANLAIGAVAFLVVTPGVMAINVIATKLFTQNKHPLELMLRKEFTPTTMVLAYLSAVVLAPLAEEMLFRGILQGWLYRVFSPTSAALPALVESDSEAEWTPLEPTPPDLDAVEPPDSEVVEDLEPEIVPGSRSRWMAIATTSFLFASVHAEQMPAPFAIFGLALALGYLYERTGSLVPSIVLHALFNGINTTMLMFALSMAPAEHASLHVDPGINKVSGISDDGRAFELAHWGWADRFSVGWVKAADRPVSTGSRDSGTAAMAPVASIGSFSTTSMERRPEQRR